MKALADPDDSVLGGAVGRQARRPAESGHRRRVDDVPLPLLDHPRHERANAVDDAPEVDPEGPLPVGEWLLPREAAGPDARVVADDVRGAEALVDFAREKLDVLPLRHVGANAQRFGS